MAEKKEEKEFLAYPSFLEFYKSMLKNVVQATKAANEMARSHDDHEFWTSFEEYKDFCSTKGNEVLNIIGGMLRHQGLHCKWQQATSQKYPHTDIEDRFESVVEANDMLLERVDSQIDEILCPSKANKALASATAPITVSIVSSWNKQTGRKKDKADQWRKFNLLTARNIQRPQLKWKRKPDNSNTPFVPILTVKPNAIKEWRPAQRFREKGTRDEIVSSVLEDFIHQQRLGENYDMFEDRHPYKFELDAFEPHVWQLGALEEQTYKALEETPLTLIDAAEQLQELLEKLKLAKEIAIDLEHHSYRSFLGFTCLMQISTRTEDFLVDTLTLRDDLWLLNDVFTDPNILKVMHGADKDIEWLQSDFGLYIVNMFDTGQAAKLMQLQRHSLAFLLKHYCQIEADKQYQLADWRLRPIPDEMVRYAREDTHYLLYIYDKMRNTLLSLSNGESNLLKAVYNMSKAICSKIYEKPIFTPDTYLDICNKYKRHLNPQQLQCMKLLIAWRDHIAREEDESYGYVLPNHMSLRIAEQMPKQLEGVLACCNPVPPLVKQNVAEIYNLVKEARTYDPRIVSRPADDSQSNIGQSVDIQSIKTCPVETLEGGDYPSALTGFEIYTMLGHAVERRQPSISVFEDELCKSTKTDNEKKARFVLDSFRSPFELYLAKAVKEIVEPGEINIKWKEASVKDKIQTNEDQRSDKQAKQVKDTQPKTAKRAIKEVSFADEAPTTLREQLPKKKREPREPIWKKNAESIMFSYEEAATGTEFVPFDYSKAAAANTEGKPKSKNYFKRPEPAKSKNAYRRMDNLGRITEEPVKQGIVRDHKKFRKGGEKSMTFRQ